MAQYCVFKRVQLSMRCRNDKFREVEDSSTVDYLRAVNMIYFLRIVAESARSLMGVLCIALA